LAGRKKVSETCGVVSAHSRRRHEITGRAGLIGKGERGGAKKERWEKNLPTQGRRERGSK